MLDNLISAVLHFSSSRQTQQKPFHYSHPLHVTISDHAFLKCAEDYKLSFANQFCGVIFADDTVLRNLFVIVHVHNFDTNDGDLNSEILHLYVTTKFLEHYKFSYGTVVLFKPIDCFPISKVVLHAQTVESYIWAKSKDWQMQLLLSTCKNKLLCRHNDVLLISPQIFGLKNSKLLFDIMVAVCEPIEQGIITMATTIFVVNVSDSLASHRSQVEFFQNKHYFSSLFPQRLENNAKLRFQPTEGKYLKLQVMQLHALLINKIFEGMTDLIDPLNIVIAPDETLEKMNISPGKLTTITASSIFSIGLESEHALQKKSRLARFVSHSVNNERACVAYISSHLWFNLTSQPTSLIESENVYIEVSSDEKTILLPPYATEIYVSLVQSPHYDGTIVCDGILKSYFSKRRYILKGDIFGIDTKDAVDFRQKSNDLDNIRCPMVYFRISVIEGPFSNCGYFADVDHSKLYQAGTIQNYIPLFIENLPSPFSGSTYFDSPNPSGMNVYVNELVSLILPVLKIWNKGSFQNFRISMNILLTGSHGSGKTVIVKSVCRCLSLHLYEVNCHEIIGESSATTEARLKSVIQKASVYVPCIMLLKNIEFIGKEKELKGENSRVLNSLSEELKNVNFWRSEWPVIVIATTNDISLLSGDLISSFLHHIHINAPLEYERRTMLRHFMHPHVLHPNVSIGYLSQRTAGFILGDLVSLAVESVRFRYSRLKQILPLQRDSFLEEALTLSGIHVMQQDLISALEKEQSSKAEKSGAPKIPSVYWEDIGGLAHAKEEILDTIQLPLKHPELLLTGLRRSGILLYGPPGTGKTLLAKAVATECSLNFLSVKGPELINMYVGQSEENVRAIFNQARSAIPCIIFFDELDSLAPSRGKSGDSGGVTDRVVSQFLAELDGINNFAQREVFVIGATNRPDLIDSALLRPGRFDRHVYVGISSDKESRLSIMTALTRKLPISSDVDLEEIVNKCPQNLTGADFYSLCSNAMMYSIKRNVKLIQEGISEIRNAERMVKTEDFLVALETLVPSLSENELQQYHSIKL